MRLVLPVIFSESAACKPVRHIDFILKCSLSIFRRFGMKKITGFILAGVLLLTVMCGCSPEKEEKAA